mmetsp:Transcript_12449/g.27239  ORF Transcript_12449/g.27239 Transcript_12449/m.27239 type:complete len:324 (-) Transcript_12449:2534-3505(-)
MPMLKPKYEANSTRHFRKSITRAERQGTVPAASINKSSGKDGSHLGKAALMLVANDGRQLFTEGLDLPIVARITLLHVNHRSSQKSSLTNVIRHIRKHGLQQRYAFGISSSGHCNSNSHATRVPNMRVETLQEKTDQLGNTFGGFVQYQRQTNHCCHSYIVAHITDCRVEQDSDSLVGSGATVCQRQAVHCSVTNDGITISPHLLNSGISVLFLPVIDQRQTHGNATNNLLMMSLTRVVTKLGNNFSKLFIRRRGGISSSTSNENHTHGNTRRLSSHGTIGVQKLLELIHYTQITRSKARQTHTQGSSVRDDLIGMRVPQMIP